MEYVKGLRCKECGERFQAGRQYICEECFGPLELEYDLLRVSDALKGSPDRWRTINSALVTSSKGFSGLSVRTPLVRAERLGKRLGIDKLYVKDEGASYPTLSFKDRVVASALSMALDDGVDTLACASTGNLANALAAHAGRSGMRSVIFVPRGTDYGKIWPAIACGADIYEVQGNYDDANRLCSEVQDSLGWAVVNGDLKPWYLEGAKTIIYEIMEDMSDSEPLALVSPMGGGGLVSMLGKGLREMEEVGLVGSGRAAIFGAQAAGCAPIVEAIKNNSDLVKPVKPDTGIGSIAIGDPPDASYAIETIRGTGGTADSASDDEAMEMADALALEEGIMTGGAGGVALSVAGKLVKRGFISNETPVVVLLTDKGVSWAPAVNASLPAVKKSGASLSDFMGLLKEESLNGNF